MALAFKVISGVLEGKIYKISPGLTVGRRKADLNLEDKKASNLHAEIVENAGQFHLRDRQSRNGLFLDGKREESILLEAGQEILIGKTLLEVISHEESDPQIADPLETWQTTLTKFNERLKTDFEFEAVDVKPIVPILKLKFIQGRQLDTEYFFGYGPRHVGGACKEFPLLEPDIPDECFKVYAESTDGTWFQTDYPEQVKLNEETKERQKLKPGDRITIGETIIEVQFLKD